VLAKVADEEMVCEATEQIMDQDVKWLYLCYLCKSLGSRVYNICEFVKDGGRVVFDAYSTDKDSILEFLKKCDAAGVDLHG